MVSDMEALDMRLYISRYTRGCSRLEYRYFPGAYLLSASRGSSPSVGRFFLTARTWCPGVFGGVRAFGSAGV